MSMQTLTYQVSFATPAFLGNAEQQAQWRTPPFKALLRQWWRVAYAANQKFNVNVASMRREEGLLFGHAWLADDQDLRGQKVAARRSLVRIRLDSWEPGKLKAWPGDTVVPHPEVPNAVGSQLYLGYGPLEYKKGTGTALKANAAIQAGETATFLIATPDEPAPLIEQALALMNRYGAVGGRSRNGWGSFALLPLGDRQAVAGVTPLRSWRDALTLDWPHTLGLDESGPLIWQTAPATDWKALMKQLAIIKIGLRTQFKFPDEKPPHSQPLDRHWLSYPITKHTTSAWKGGFRLPNSLRFKIRPTKEDPKRLIGVVFHVPCLPPTEFAPNRNAIARTWQLVHALLDELTKSSNTRGYDSIIDAQRRAKLKPQLDTVSLTRIPE